MVTRSHYTLELLKYLDHNTYDGPFDDLSAVPYGDRPKLSFYNWLLLKKPGPHLRYNMARKRCRDNGLEWLHDAIRKAAPNLAKLKTMTTAEDLYKFLVLYRYKDEAAQNGVVVLFGEYLTYCDDWQQNNSIK